MLDAYPIEVLVTGEENEEFAFSIPLGEGSHLASDQYDLEYSITGQPTLTKGSGITATVSKLSFQAGHVRLTPGKYPHRCHVVEIATGTRSPFFDGFVNIGEEMGR
ncbi:hypothetical protein ACD578_15860 [Microvirga sp. RSM25]|uniref:hypothetical protein n=1 Tax=Microvirga sp. RSM25 TaxID=3273802 RepID=UPI003850C327